MANKITLTFNVDKNAQPIIEFDCGEIDKNTAYLVAVFLTRLNYGFYTEDMYQVISDKYGGNKEFIDDLIASFQIARNLVTNSLEEKAQIKDNELVMPPLNFFKENGFNGR